MTLQFPREINRGRPGEATSTSDPPDGSIPQRRFCTGCGSPHQPADRFCSSCGQKLAIAGIT